MNVDHDSRLALAEAEALVNSGDARAGHDVLATPEALDRYLDQRHISGARTSSDGELRAVRRLRSRLRAIFELAVAGERDAVVEAVNELVANAGAVPQLVEHDGNPLHLHYTPGDAPLQHRLGAGMAVALAVVLRDGGLDRLRICESPDCRRVFVDVSRNRSRRYCDAQCANRQHVAAYRERQAFSPVARGTA